jgi:UrcA family protein
MLATALRSTLTLALATAATVGIIAFSAAPAAAETPRTAHIETRGVDLTSPIGRARIEAQVRRTARTVCGAGDTQAWRAAPAIHACYTAALAAARLRIEALAAAASEARTAIAGTTAANISAR